MSRIKKNGSYLDKFIPIGPFTREGEKYEEKSVEVVDIPLKHISYESDVYGVFAKVKCVQKYKNESTHSIEAVYVFPMPDDASVVGCKMVIGDKKIDAILKKKEDAKKEYQDAIDSGNHASLLEQERPNIFTMSVGGIESNEEIDVEVEYVQRIPWQAGGGRFNIPLVVAPKFIPGTPQIDNETGNVSVKSDIPDADRISPKVTKEGVKYNADIKVNFNPGFACKLSSPSHGSIVTEKKIGKQGTTIETGDILTDRDFVLVYKSTVKIPEIATFVGKKGKESFGIINIFPPDVENAGATDTILVLDCSGSMNGAKIDGLKILAKKLVNNLHKDNPKNRIAIVPFDSIVRDTLKFNSDNKIKDIEKFIDGLWSAGCTRLGDAMAYAYSMFDSNSKNSKQILLISDGQTEDRVNINKDIRVIGVGIDSAVNDTTINNITKETNGISEWVYPGEDYSTIANRLVGYLSGPVLSGIKVVAGKGEVFGVSDVFRGRPASIVVRFPGKVGRVEVEGFQNDINNKWHCTSGDWSDSLECDFISNIWAREFIRENKDEGEQTKISLKYGVICSYTAFVAVSTKAVPGEKPVVVEIPVNLPSGWNYDKIFGLSGGLSGMSRGFLSPGVYCNFSVVGASCGSMSAGNTLGSGKMTMLKGQRTNCSTLGFVGNFHDATSDIDSVDWDISIRLNKALEYLEDGNRGEAEKIIFDIQKELTVDKIGEFSDEECSKVYYLVASLLKYGFKFNKSVMAELSVEPAKTSDGYIWYNKAKKEIGLPCDKS